MCKGCEEGKPLECRIDDCIKAWVIAITNGENVYGYCAEHKWKAHQYLNFDSH